ncbi:MAG: putative toxin-antitoxin system toxin component, PIN family [Anaerolineae bacterium]|nr:putative toxin-antitoxin system toxin component, PIN family [Anaerolineae bacterium]
MALILLRGAVLTVTRQITVCRDPKDNVFLEIGVAGEADAIVSSDEDLLVLHLFTGIPILIPTEFLGRLSAWGTHEATGSTDRLMGSAQASPDGV